MNDMFQAALRGALLVCLFLISPHAHATTYGCISSGGMYSPTPSNIEYYIRTELETNGLGPVSGSDAIWEIRSALDKLRRESGADVFFEYKGTTSTLDCTGSTTAGTYSAPTVIIRRTTDCSACDRIIGGVTYHAPACATHYYENTTEMNCGRITFIDNPGSCAEHAWGAYGDNSPNSEDDILFTTMHEAVHTLAFSHDADCPGVTDSNESVMHGYASERRSLSLADKRYLRSNYLFGHADITYQYDNAFDPGSWTEVGGSPANLVISPIAMASVDDNDRGVDWLTAITDAKSEIRAYICESSCAVETPTNYDVYFQPAINRSNGEATDKWIIAGLYNDSMTTRVKDIIVTKRDVGSGTWSASAINVDTKRSAISAAFDAPEHRFILTYLNNSDEIQIAYAAIGSNSWVDVDTNIKSMDGATVACDEVQDQSGDDNRNCLMTWADVEAGNALKWLRFRLDPGTNSVSLGTVRSLGYIGSSRPSVSNNVISDTGREFLLTFGQASRTMYMRSLDGNSTTWQYSTVTSATNINWYGPGNLGFRNNAAGKTYVYFSE